MTWKTRFTRIYDIRPSATHPSVRPPLIRPSVSAFYPNPSILIKHAFSDNNNSNLFSVARTSEESQVLGISADIRIIFPLRKHVL